MATYQGREIKVVVETGKLLALSAQIQAKAKAILDKTAFDIENSAKQMAPVDTGALRSSIYVSGASGAGTPYTAARADAAGRAASRGKRAEFAAEVRAANEWQRVIAPSVVYAIFPEIQGQAYLAPAVEMHRAAFIQAWTKVVNA